MQLRPLLINLTLLLILTLTAPTYADVAFVSATGGNVGASAATSLTVSATNNSCTPNCVAVAIYSTNCATACPGSDPSATYAGVAMTFVTKATNVGQIETSLFVLANPASGTNNVIWTNNGTNNSQLSAGGIAFLSGANQVTPLGTSGNFITSATNAAITITIPTGGLGLAGFGKKNSTEAITIGSGNGETQSWANTVTTNATATANVNSFGEHSLSTGSQSLDANSATARNWAAIAVPVNPAMGVSQLGGILFFQ